MPRVSSKIGFRCVAVNDGQPCKGFMSVGRSEHSKEMRWVSRVRVCKVCGAVESTIETSVNGPQRAFNYRLQSRASKQV